MRTVRCTGRWVGACIPACTGQGVCVYPSMYWAGGVCLSGGGLPHTPPPVGRMTDACEHITLPQLRCGR